MNKHIILSFSLCSLLATTAFANPGATQPAAATNKEAASPTTEQAENITESLTGKILQTMNGGGYTYVYLEQQNDKKIWVAVTETPVKVGSAISFKPGMVMVNFESKALKRTFDSIIFSGGVISGAVSEKSANKIDVQGDSVGSQGAIASKTEKISIPKATGAGATTVEGAYKNSTKLNNKKVTIKGKVVKSTSGIMSRNWIHIQDGTGSEKNKTHNLVCTSTQMADVGDIVTISGKLIKDKDFGSGYKYKVIIEDAKISK